MQIKRRDCINLFMTLSSYCGGYRKPGDWEWKRKETISQGLGIYRDKLDEMERLREIESQGEKEREIERERERERERKRETDRKSV